jgi:folate-binding protein YgfZ
MQAERCSDRTVLRITGEDRQEFLQGLVSNDVGRLAKGLVYAALLSPQGKYLADFFLVPAGDAILLDVKTDLAAGLGQRLTMYRLRAKVAIDPADLPVYRGLGDPPPGAYPDPRDASLGWRFYGEMAADPVTIDWDALRVAAGVPETGIELIPNETFILEAGFERLAGVDFRKGCYVGQEVTARMKHKTELRKGLVRVLVEGSAPAGTLIEAAGKPVGTLYTQAQGRGLAHLRLDRADGAMQAGDCTVRIDNG